MPFFACRLLDSSQGYSQSKSRVVQNYCTVDNSWTAALRCMGGQHWWESTLLATLLGYEAIVVIMYLSLWWINCLSLSEEILHACVPSQSTTSTTLLNFNVKGQGHTGFGVFFCVRDAAATSELCKAWWSGCRMWDSGSSSNRVCLP